jgi:hypothetical protein
MWIYLCDVGPKEQAGPACSTQGIIAQKHCRQAVGELGAVIDGVFIHNYLKWIILSLCR